MEVVIRLSYFYVLSPSDVAGIYYWRNHSVFSSCTRWSIILAIGKRGQNACFLAVRLTGWKIDIKSVSEAVELGLIRSFKTVNIIRRIINCCWLVLKKSLLKKWNVMMKQLRKLLKVVEEPEIEEEVVEVEEEPN